MNPFARYYLLRYLKHECLGKFDDTELEPVTRQPWYGLLREHAWAVLYADDEYELDPDEQCALEDGGDVYAPRMLCWQLNCFSHKVHYYPALEFKKYSLRRRLHVVELEAFSMWDKGMRVYYMLVDRLSEGYTLGPRVTCSGTGVMEQEFKAMSVPSTAITKHVFGLGSRPTAGATIKAGDTLCIKDGRNALGVGRVVKSVQSSTKIKVKP